MKLKIFLEMKNSGKNNFHNILSILSVFGDFECKF